MIPIPAIPLPYKIIGLLTITVSVFAYGYHRGFLSSEKDNASANLKALETFNAQIKAKDAVLRELVKHSQTKQVEKEIVYQEIERKIEDATDDRVCFSHDSLSLWNDAISASVTVPKATAGTPQVSGATDSATDEEVLRNAVKNFKTCNKYREQIIDIIEADKRIHEDQ